ncbi:hypothetical protein BMW23_0724 [Bodo saltans virus]|uniref:Uncharacterized protein n=1 Tax=Bodo saltans virus TaxID=2024608 RepID=A0A2H4UV24_9VIRU|nr:hypothetical protein QJ851_gp0707 [Bodo saltans virus]ATZ80770.1 hypothetical protein BMW23_0724 [Bodo saltans virus]
MSDSPTFYTTDELNEIKNKIKAFMEIDSLEINQFDDDFTKQCKITALIAKDAQENGHAAKIVNAYIDYPPFMFYTDLTYNSIRRIYGFGITTDDIIIAHAVTAMFIVNNDVVGGVDLTECVHVKQWSESQLSKLTSGMVNGADALIHQWGFMNFAR